MGSIKPAGRIGIICLFGATVESRPTYRLRVSTRFWVPAEDVWAHKTDPKAIMAEFPMWVPFRINRPDDLIAALSEGASTVRSPARVGLLPWEVQVQIVEPGRLYVDRSESSLMNFFVHQHCVEVASDGTHYTDDIWFTPAVAPALTARLLRRVFAARHTRAAQVMPADPRTVGHAVLRRVLEDETVPAFILGE
jgi:ligand-binding SRPBCC domain-containing protein